MLIHQLFETVTTNNEYKQDIKIILNQMFVVTGVLLSYRNKIGSRKTICRYLVQQNHLNQLLSKYYIKVNMNHW